MLEHILNAQISVGEILTHVGTLALIAGSFLKSRDKMRQVVERSDMMWSDYCEKHEIQFIPINGD